MDDVRESVAELAYYKRHFLLDTPPPPAETLATGATAATTKAGADPPNGTPG
jgi:hypothetical protein